MTSTGGVRCLYFHRDGRHNAVRTLNMPWYNVKVLAFEKACDGYRSADGESKQVGHTYRKRGTGDSSWFSGLTSTEHEYIELSGVRSSRSTVPMNWSKCVCAGSTRRAIACLEGIVYAAGNART